MLQPAVQTARPSLGGFRLPLPLPSARDEIWPGTTGVRETVARDAALLWEGDRAEFCYKIVSGAVRICRLLADGRRQVIDFLLPGDLVGFDNGETYAFSAEAIVDTVVLRQPRHAIEATVAANPKLGRQLLTIACARLAAAQSQILLLGRKNAAEKLASFILALADRTGVSGAEDEPVDLAMMRADIADYLGLTIETVSRTFTNFRRGGAIDLPDVHQIVIRDRDALEDLAGD